MVYQTGILLGQITKTSGYEGAVLVRLERNLIENIPEMESVFVETDGRPVPFFIEWSEYQGADTIRLKFSNYDSETEVQEFKGCKVFLTDYEASGGITETDFTMFTGFNVLDQDKKLAGRITEITENPGQLLLNVESPSGKEVLLPLHEDLIISIDERKKVIIMNIPEGLTEINS